MTKEISGWGLYPKIKTKIFSPESANQIIEYLDSSRKTNSIIARGMGRSYGDSALAKNIFDTTKLNHFISFDEKTGLLSCLAGVTLDNILKYLAPKGWFLPVTPGTKFITIGGAIASDVHGKNHHIDGCFSEFIKNIKLILATGEIINCSQSENPEIFYATCGGMGLTGIIIEATLQLTPIKSTFIKQTIIKTKNLRDTLEKLEEHESYNYSAAWLDCINGNNNLGRGIILLGEHENKYSQYALSNNLNPHNKGKLNIPFYFPDFVLNKYSMSIFNKLYYQKSLKSSATYITHYDNFFYPLDKINNWNYIYGKQGFLQYQFVIPKDDNGINNLFNILQYIKNYQQYPNLAVLKLFGNANNNYLSFPKLGYTLTLDFKISTNIFKFLNNLDKKILDYNGKIYLTKDARMSKTVFKESYANLDKFLKIKNQVDPDNLFRSMQFDRLFV